ncbi:hypothetical protein CO174_02340 [Candidatus Uhrbacteria bacterium CG_4_9_14_3_um_filter_50_9]|uniref:t-SNARE coiled-coil homology domain-containing protein n=1 Tax=Candidatus Uhrbacteria bacterium CG_4_9_14_3_um_filter_50_9 TaxID=1975035 RepID=A0A2M7XCJ7_9BACT|nr:MAG: hypothetical protein CO174_02340 [Candidatus Uhrbacteria bacterium CG_4_9_14_3_um_filter_50_9]
MNDVATKTDINDIKEILHAMNGRFDRVDERFDRIDNRLDNLETEMEDLARTTKRGFDDLGKKVEINTERIARAGLMMSQGI